MNLQIIKDMNSKIEILKFYKDSFLEKSWKEKCEIILDSQDKLNKLLSILIQENDTSLISDVNLLRADNITSKPAALERLFKLQN